jgi:hypothetical protein
MTVHECAILVPRYEGREHFSFSQANTLNPMEQTNSLARWLLAEIASTGKKVPVFGKYFPF